jgi:hypothetical protein
VTSPKEPSASDALGLVSPAVRAAHLETFRANTGERWLGVFAGAVCLILASYAAACVFTGAEEFHKANTAAVPYSEKGVFDNE